MAGLSAGAKLEEVFAGIGVFVVLIVIVGPLFVWFMLGKRP